MASSSVPPRSESSVLFPTSSSSPFSFSPKECSCSPDSLSHAPLSFAASFERDSGDGGCPACRRRPQAALEEVLPLELLHHVLGFLPLQDLAGTAARVNRLWRGLALDPSLWLPHWRRLHSARPSVELTERDVTRGVQPPPEGECKDDQGGDPWLLDAGCSLQEALNRDVPVDWRREYLRRKKFSVLIVTYHTSHNNHYDLDVVRQLKKFGIQTDICHLMCCNHKPDKIDDSGLYRFVEFDDNLFLKYDTIIYFAAMSGGDALKKSLGDNLMEYLKSGGGVIFCIYTHMKSYQLLGKWTERFYPFKPSFLAPLAQLQAPHRLPHHPITSGVKRTQIDSARLGSRFNGQVDPLARVVAEYDDGVPLVIIFDEEANHQKGLEEQQEEAEESRGDEVPPSDDEENGSEESQTQPSDLGNEIGDTEGHNEAAAPRTPSDEQWGKTVFLNVFPVTKDDTSTGGWYDWNSDLPLLLRNAVLFAARKAPSTVTKMAV